MPYKFDWKNNGYIITLTGHSSSEEINEANSAIQDDHRFDEHRYQIWNHLDADFSFIDKNEACIPASIDSVVARYVFGIKIALVVKEPSVIEFCKKYIEDSKVFQSEWDIQLFDNMDDAIKWAEVLT